MTLRLGVYGHGPQSKRYLDPKNWPDGVEVVQLEREQWKHDCAGVIAAGAPRYHYEVAVCSLQSGKPVLTEKPFGLSTRDAEGMLLEADHYRLPLLAAHINLWHPGFQRLIPDRHATVRWCGDERSDGSCPAILDWGPHAWSMAIALGTDRVSTGKGERHRNKVVSLGQEFIDLDSREGRPMRDMLATFSSLIDGGYDWRAEPDFALEVHRRCFRPSG